MQRHSKLCQSLESIFRAYLPYLQKLITPIKTFLRRTLNYLVPALIMYWKVVLRLKPDDGEHDENHDNNIEE
jgi:hypothetical protein